MKTKKREYKNTDDEVDTTVKKIDSRFSPKGKLGQKYLVSGKNVSLRLFENESVGEKQSSKRDYETVGYVISGQAELIFEAQSILLLRTLIPSH